MTDYSLSVHPDVRKLQDSRDFARSKELIGAMELFGKQAKMINFYEASKLDLRAEVTTGNVQYSAVLLL